MAEKKQIQEYIEILKDNIESLKQSYLRLKAENEELFAQKQELQKQLKQKDKVIDDLKQEIENLKVSNALIFASDDINAENLQEIKHEAKIKLNQIIKEIDTAIKLLTVNEL